MHVGVPAHQHATQSVINKTVSARHGV